MSISRTVELRCNGKLPNGDHCPTMHFGNSGKEVRRYASQFGWVNIRSEDFCAHCIAESGKKKR
jgi:hypothetical protein